MCGGADCCFVIKRRGKPHAVARYGTNTLHLRMQASAGLLVTTSQSMQAAEAYKEILTDVWMLQSKSVQTHSPANVTTADVSSVQATELACVCVCVWNSPL